MKEFAKFVGIFALIGVAAYVLDAGLSATGAYKILVWLPIVAVGGFFALTAGRVLVDHFRGR